MVRYAIYFAPPPESALWRAGTAWLGRDPETGELFDTPAVSGYTSAQLAGSCAAARRYGFHATLKAPFTLASGATRATLEQALRDFCRARAPVSLPPLEIAVLGGFIALMLRDECAALRELAFDCVRTFEPLRAPATPEELRRRRAAGLDAIEERNLVRYGYPYVGDAYRFHMTLTDRLEDTARARLLPALRQWFAPVLALPVVLGDLALFEEPAADAPLRLLCRVPLEGAAQSAHL